MRNERLQAALTATGVTIKELSQWAGVDPKTAERWIYEGRTPRRATAKRAAAGLGVPSGWLWPRLDTQHVPVTDGRGDFLRLYTHRTEVPTDIWRELAGAVTSVIEIQAVSALSILAAEPELLGIIGDKAAGGAAVRLLLADHRITQPAGYDDGSAYQSAADRSRTARGIFDPLIRIGQAELRWHRGMVYNSLFRFDNEMLVHQHVYGSLGYVEPIMHVRKLTDTGLFDMFATGFERAWAHARTDDGLVAETLPPPAGDDGAAP